MIWWSEHGEDGGKKHITDNFNSHLATFTAKAEVSMVGLSSNTTRLLPTHL